MSVSIPLFNELTNYSQDIELDSVQYKIEILWNHRSKTWYLSLLNESNEPIIVGIPAVLNYDILYQFRANINVPKGSMFFVDFTEKEREITRDNFGKTVSLVYIGDTES